MLPTGFITLWAGAIVDIPNSWVLCDGNNGTPNLTDKFVVGAGDSYNVGDNGGGAGHQHAFTGDGHAHGIPGGAGLNIGANFIDSTDSQSATGTTDLDSTDPPYYALAYIMKT